MSTRGSRRHDIAHSGAPPQRRTSVLVAAETRQKVDAETAEKDVSALSLACRGSSASSIGGWRTSMSPAPFVAIEAASAAASPTDSTATPTALANGCADPSLSRVAATLARASAARTFYKGRARSGSGNAVPRRETAHDPSSGSSLPPSLAVKDRHHQHRCGKFDKEEHSSGSSAGPHDKSQRARLAADVCADQPKLSRHPYQLGVENFSELTAEPAPPRRRVSAYAAPFGPSSWSAFTGDRAEASSPTAAPSAVEASHSPVTSSSHHNVTSRANHTGRLKPSLPTTPGSPKAMNVTMPSMCFIYTRTSNRSTDRNREKPKYRSLSAATNALSDEVCAVVAASTESSATAMKVGDFAAERVAATTHAASAPVALPTQPLLRRGTLPQANTKGTLGQPNARALFARSLTHTCVRAQEARPAAQSSSEGHGRPADEKRNDAARKDADHAADGVLRHTSARDFEEASHSHLQRWRQRQEENRSRAKDVTSISASTPPVVESATTLRDALVKNTAGAAPREQELKPLPSEPVTDASWQRREKRAKPSTQAVSTANTDLAVAPQPPTEEPERQHRISVTVEARNAASPPTVSGSFLLSEVRYSGTVPDLPEAALASVASKRNSKASTTPAPEPPSTAQSRSVIDGSAAAAARNHEAQAESTANVSTHLPPSKSSPSCCLTEDPRHRVAAKDGIPVDREAQPPPLPSAQHTSHPGFVSVAAEGVTPANRWLLDRTSAHQSAPCQTTKGPTATAKEDAAPFLSASTADMQGLFRAVLGRREQRLRLQEYSNAGRVSPEQPTSIEAPAGASGGVEVSPVFSSLEQPSTRHTTVTSSPCTSPWALTQGATVSPPLKVESTRSAARAARAVALEGVEALRTSSVVSSPAGPEAGENVSRSGGGVAAEAHTEPVLSARRMGGDLRSSFSTTEVSAEQPSPGIKLLQSAKDEELTERRPSSRTPGAYTPLLHWIRQNRTQLSLPSSGAPTLLPAVDVAAGRAAIPAATEIEQNPHLVERRAPVNKYHRPSRTTSDTEVDHNEAQLPEAGASWQAPNELLLRKLADARGSHRRSSTNSSVCVPSLDKGVTSVRHPTPAPAHPLCQGAAAGHRTPVAEGALLPHAPTSSVADDAKGASACAVASLGDIPLDELDKLEQSINALLTNYGSRKTAGEGSAPAKLTAAAALMRETSPPAKTSTSTNTRHRKAMAAVNKHSKNNSKDDTLAPSNSQDSSCAWPHHSCAIETDDDDSQLEGSGLWCGDEDAHEANPPPVFVPPLDLTLLLLPTGDSEELKPYRIPLPSAVPAPEEAHRRFLCSIGAYAAAFREEGSTATADDSLRAGAVADAPSAPASMTGAEDAAQPPGNSASLNDSCALPSRRVSKGCTSLTPVSPFVNERVRRMRASRQPFSSTGTSTVNVRSPRVSHHATGAVKDGAEKTVSEEADAGNPLLMEKAADAIPTEENEMLRSSGEAGHVRSHVAPLVLFTDDSDALDGGRGAERDRRVNRQRSRVQRILLNCQEQRERKDTVLDELNIFKTLTKRF
ncbi:conserved hypothetical protein [Leishmania major strain Friedlin]|uniref:Uncharacterized protein n=1 Tax=Leishmania major TaxID=5664 RepID=Q4Q6D2_LEIMA|nr:conserved hypothetical protein [Leishmania major strain Friedlin]CAG9579296.1 hypothetical_protein_-_conserved [Leishmania major strain Friedlin]CAJ08318.1 conserved hypothetical protein [Leishmania major strain Friedlin]|eukprot:XP_001685116.1 conserved hypothetical protein [Leishmania major strain Friedlin]